MMDKGEALKGIQANIRGGNRAMASSQIMELVSVSADDPFSLLTCISLLKVIEDETGASEVVKMLCESVDTKNVTEISKGLRNMGYSKETILMLSEVTDTGDNIFRTRALALSDVGRYADAVREQENIVDRTISDDILLTEILCSMKEYEKAKDIAKNILSESSEFDVRKCMYGVMTASGDRKGADRFVKDILKKEKDSADSSALAAYHMWVEGKIPGAAAYATKALKLDPGHVGAMEIFAYCLAEKGKTAEARIVAGAINEKAPGHPSVIKILEICRDGT